MPTAPDVSRVLLKGLGFTWSGAHGQGKLLLTHKSTGKESEADGQRCSAAVSRLADGCSIHHRHEREGHAHLPAEELPIVHYWHVGGSEAAGAVVAVAHVHPGHDQRLWYKNTRNAITKIFTLRSGHQINFLNSHGFQFMSPVKL